MNDKRYDTSRPDSRILTSQDVKEMPKWLQHFFIFVVKPIAATLVGWIDQMKEALKESNVK